MSGNKLDAEKENTLYEVRNKDSNHRNLEITYQIKGTQLKRFIFFNIFTTQVALDYGVHIFSYISYAQIFQRLHRSKLFHVDDGRRVIYSVKPILRRNFNGRNT